MKKIINAPENYVDEMLQGIYAAHGDQVKYVNDDLRCYCTANKKDGKVAIKGWLETSQDSWETFFDRMQALGVRTVICTDISRDGAMRGANLALYRTLASRYSMDIIASGGVSSLEDIRALKEAGAAGAIIGKAYYTGAIDLAQAIALGEAGEP